MAWLSRDRLRETLSHAVESAQLREKVGLAAAAVQQKLRNAGGEEDEEARLDREAHSLASLRPEAAAAQLRRWEQRLAAAHGDRDAAAGAGAAAAAAAGATTAGACDAALPLSLQALVASGALRTAVENAIRSPALRVAFIRSGPGCADPSMDAETAFAEAMVRLLALASNFPPTALSGLLSSYAEAYEESERRRRAKRAGSGDAAPTQPARQTVRWLRAVLDAALNDWQRQQVDLLECAAVVRAARRALEGAADVAEVRPSPGDVCWAARPSDGRWLPARVLTVDGTDIKVAWRSRSAPPSAASPASDSAAASGPVGTEAENQPTTAVDTASEASSEQPTDTGPVAQVVTLPACVLADTSVQDEAVVASQAGSCKAHAGCEECLAAAQACGARGREARSLLAEFQSCRGSFLGGSAAAGRLATAVDSLVALRTEREQYAQVLGEEVARCDDAVKGCHSQVRESSAAYRLELAGLQERRMAVEGRIAALTSRRAGLLAQLAELDGDLAREEADVRELRRNEKRLEDNMRHVSEELSGWLSTEGSRQDLCAEERRMILDAGSVALVVETELSARASAARAAAMDCEDAGCVGTALATVCLLTEHQRLRALDDIATHPGDSGCRGAESHAGDDSKCSDLSSLKRVVHGAVGLASRSRDEARALAAELRDGFLAAPAERGAEDSAASALRAELARLEERYRDVEAKLRARLGQLRSEHDAEVDVVCLSPPGDVSEEEDDME